MDVQSRYCPVDCLRQLLGYNRSLVIPGMGHLHGSVLDFIVDATWLVCARSMGSMGCSLGGIYALSNDMFGDGHFCRLERDSHACHLSSWNEDARKEKRFSQILLFVSIASTAWF
mmetsp:Transcript_13664/g.27467  ORF Transcript_13664/g.27467 Transcript_13664/m.27467 type:complete len:115 (-) Transcript_13664:326-670(-)